MDDCLFIPRQERLLDYLGRLLLQPPRVLLLEGGRTEERATIAKYWAAALNCTATQKPCRTCSVCRWIAQGEFTDMHYLDGREGRIGIDAVRDLRPLLGQAPRQAGGRRIIVLGEAQELTVEAANALLKSMEDMDAYNHFVLLAPQRERLLPTLVSRSWVLTLGWFSSCRKASSGDDEKENVPGVAQWLAALEDFLRTGKGWFAMTMAKPRIDKSLAAGLIHECRSSLIAAMQHSPREGLATFFYGLGAPHAWRNMDLRLIQAEQALVAQVSPLLVLDWLVMGLRQYSTSCNKEILEKRQKTVEIDRVQQLAGITGNKIPL
ncbi:MAG TPA: DNA polymerase III subunit delta' [Desulfonatronum sp.]|nr:DNA polymerase III subunit delta' [Desulfonatronum sp.]